MSTAILKRVPTTTLLLSLLLLISTTTTFSSATAAGSSRSSFGFPIHHRFSDPVKAMLAGGGGAYLPEKGTVDYFAVLAERDRVHGRRLAAAADDRPPLTFAAGNYTYRVSDFGFLYYANVSVGTPAKYFLVALDTGSDRFWLPCDCIKCVTALDLGGGNRVDFSIYSLNTSSTGAKVPCTSPMCEGEAQDACLSSDQCPYKVQYLSQNTSSSGYLVEDVLYLASDTNPSKPASSKVTFGCGQRQEGSFLSGGAPNGLFGLGMDKGSVPSILASQNLTANSFSMCFAAHSVVGRISFGDTGTSNQSETPFLPRAAHPTYNVSISQISVGKTVKDVDDSAIMDSGTSFTALKDPVYSLVTENFDSQVKEERAELNTGFPFEYCYSLSSCDGEVDIPAVNFTFEGGAKFSALHPIIGIQNGNTCLYCLAVLKNNMVNIIGQNFMSGYRIVFNRDKMVLGWEESDCNYEFDTNTLPMGPGVSPSISSSNLNPEAIPAQNSGASETGSASTVIIAGHILLSTTIALIIVLFV